MRRMHLFYVAVITLLTSNICQAQAGSLDTIFRPMQGVNNEVTASGIQTDGKILIGGSFTSFNGVTRNGIARLNEDGTLDTSFDPGLGVDGIPVKIHVLSGGKILVQGSFTTYNGVARNQIARVNSDGTIDPVFDPGIGTDAGINSSAVQSDGKVIIVGNFTSVNGTGRNNIARLNADGTLDLSFNPGVGPNGSPTDVKIQSDGRVVVVGGFTQYAGISRNRIVRLNTNGSIDLSFAPGTGVSGGFLTYVSDVDIQLDGKIVITGQFTGYNGTTRNKIARVNSDGSLDASFDPGSGINGTAMAVSVQDDEKVVIAGEFTGFDGTARNNVARINSDGSCDLSYDPGSGLDDIVQTIAVQSDGKVIIGGSFLTFDGTNRLYLARSNQDGSLDSGFLEETGVNNFVLATAIQSDGKILLGGMFDSFDGVERIRISRQLQDGTLDLGFDPGLGADGTIVEFAVQNDGKILIVGGFNSYNGVGRSSIARLNADGSLDLSFNPGTGANPSISSIRIQSDGRLLIAGNFTTFNGVARNGIARLNSDGSLDLSFDPGTGAQDIYSLAIQTDGKIVVAGGFTSFNGTSVNRIVRLQSNGSIDPTFNSGTGVTGGFICNVKDVILQTDGKMVIGGSFTGYNGVTRNRIARMNTNGSLDLTFDPGIGPDNSPNDLVLQPDGKIVIAGSFGDYSGTPINGIVRVNSDGSLDPNFDPGAGPDGGIVHMSLQPDGKIVIAGAFDTYDNEVRFRIARLNGDCQNNSGTEVITACGPYTWIDGITYSSSNNTASWVLTNSGGCDSTVTLDLIINSATSGTHIITECDYYTWIDGNTYFSSNNTATHTLTNAAGCDSLVTLNLTIVESSSEIQTITACDSYTWIDGNTYTSTPATFVQHNLINAAGCDSTVYLDLTVNYSSSSMEFITTCDSYTWPVNGITYSSSGAYAATVTNASGCDSIVTLDLTINSSTTGTDVITACDSYTWIDGNTYTSSNNTATFTLTNTSGCDSIVTLDLTINSSTIGTDVITACDSYIWIDGNTYTSSNNTATFTLTNTSGCDSIVTLDLTINSSTTGTDVITACDSYTWIDGNPYTSSNNTATFTLTNTAGCDSIVTLDLTINSSTTGTDVITACDSYTWIDGNTYTSSNNTATFTLTNTSGCDSIVTLDLTINSSTTGTDVITACDSYTWIDGNTYTSLNNTATFTLTNTSGCDSIVTLDLTINSSTTGTDVITACDSYTWIDGNTYTSSNNTATFTLTNTSGCDSIVTLDLTINSSTTGTDVITACDSYIWIDGNTYTSSNNTATFTLTNTSGCDSIVTLDLTINSSTTGTDVITACDSYIWIDGNTYTSSNNTATFTLTNSAGCDSIVTLDLTINSSTTGTDVITACDSYTWIDGNTYTSSNNTATFTLTNTAGCDSIVTLDLTINSSTTGTDVITACDSYTWIDGNTYTSSNNTATFTLTNIAGCDSIVTLDLTINSSTIGTDVITACDSYAWIDGNTYTSSNNTATFTLTNTAGCDSIVTLDLTINLLNLGVVLESDEATITASGSNATYQWVDCGNGFLPIAGANGQSFTATANGNYAVIITDNGCTDTSECVSVITLDLSDLQSPDLMLVYPNPTQEKFYLSGASESILSIEVVDMLGRKLAAVYETYDKDLTIVRIAPMESQIVLVHVTLMSGEQFKTTLKIN